MHPQAYSFVKRALADLAVAGAHVVEIGSLDVNSTEQGLSVRELCADAASYTGVDVRKGPGVDLVKDVRDVLIKDLPHRPDLVICCETLEHDDDPASLIAAAYSLLAMGGVFILTAAGEDRQPHGVDGGGVGDEWYQNIGRADLKAWLADWTDVHIHEDHVAHDIYAVAVKPKKVSKKAD
jgi:SAM-dependent methyltransferase